MFLKKLYKEWRFLFWAVLLFMAAQLFFMAKAIENVPFFLYHMYSKDHRPMDSIAVYLVKTPQGYLNHKQLSNREEEILMNSISYFVNLKNDGDGTIESVDKRFKKIVPASLYNYLKEHLCNDSAALERFPQWWASYLRSVTGNNYDEVSVVRSYVYPNAPYAKSNFDSIVFIIKIK